LERWGRVRGYGRSCRASEPPELDREAEDHDVGEQETEEEEEEGGTSLESDADEDGGDAGKAACSRDPNEWAREDPAFGDGDGVEQREDAERRPGDGEDAPLMLSRAS